MIEEIVSEHWVVIDEETHSLIAVDDASGGYPYKAGSITAVEYFPTREAAEKYASHWPNHLVVARARLSLQWDRDV